MFAITIRIERPRICVRFDSINFLKITRCLNFNSLSFIYENVCQLLQRGQRERSRRGEEEDATFVPFVLCTKPVLMNLFTFGGIFEVIHVFSFSLKFAFFAM